MTVYTKLSTLPPDMFSILGSQLISQVIESKISRTSYLLFSTTEFAHGSESKVISVGMFDNIILLGELGEFDWLGDKKEKSLLSECDASLGAIRTQMRIYYGENRSYPISNDWSPVIGEAWCDMEPGYLTGRYFNDDDFTYWSNGSEYKIKCNSSHLLEGDRTLDHRGSLRFE